MKVTVIREMIPSATGASRVLVKKGNKYFVVSSVVAPFTGFETLVFPATKTGKVTDFGAVAGGRGVSREEAISELEGK